MEGSTQIINHFNLVEMEFKYYQPGYVYHTEDWIINENFAPKFIRRLYDQEIVNVLNIMAISDLNQAIQLQNQSLFVVKTRQILDLWDEISYGRFKVRITFVDNAGTVHQRIPVTDLLTLAFIKYQKSKNGIYAPGLINYFNRNPYRYIRIGLTRQFRGKYWKQVTALITIPDLFNRYTFSFYENQIGTQV